MWPMIRAFFTDETAFVGYLRALLMGVGILQVSYPDAFLGFPKWVGMLAMMGAVMIRAGEPNRPAGDSHPRDENPPPSV